MGISDLIAEFIAQELETSNGFTELKRRELAEMFSCVPSQINYVISTRFSPEHGYAVESRRGGGGYIRITRVRHSPRELVMHTVNSVGTQLDLKTAAAFVSNIYSSAVIDRKTADLLMAAISDRALINIAPSDRDTIRASIFKQMLVTYIS